MKKLIGLIIIIVILFITFMYILYMPKDYTINYKINDFKVEESYVKNIEAYKVKINYKGVIYPFIVSKKYTKNRKIIDKIKKEEIENAICLHFNLNSKKNILCNEDGQLKDYNLLINVDLSLQEIETFNKTNIFHYGSNKYFIWNYNGYDVLTNKKLDQIKLLGEDEYDNKLSYQINNHIITPNYDSDYYFKEIIILNMDNLKETKLKFNEEISYNSRFIGNNKNKAYLVDEKNKKQYVIDIKKMSLDEVNRNGKGIILNNSELKYIPIKNIINDKLSFIDQKKYNYIIKNDRLYLEIDKIKILLSNKEVKEIVKIDEDSIFYLSYDYLIKYTLFKGETILLKNEEWNFNYKNKIFILD